MAEHMANIEELRKKDPFVLVTINVYKGNSVAFAAEAVRGKITGVSTYWIENKTSKSQGAVSPAALNAFYKTSIRTNTVGQTRLEIEMLRKLNDFFKRTGQKENIINMVVETYKKGAAARVITKLDGRAVRLDAVDTHMKVEITKGSVQIPQITLFYSYRNSDKQTVHDTKVIPVPREFIQEQTVKVTDFI